MITTDRLDELECFRLEDDTPDDARISIPWRDLRDLVALIPIAREAMAWGETGEDSKLYEAVADLTGRVM